MLYLYLLPFQLMSSPSMDWLRRACYFGEENAVFTVSVNGLAFHMLALLLAYVRDGYQVVREHWGGDRVAVDNLGDRSHNVCVSPLDAADFAIEVSAFSLSENVQCM